MKLFISEYNDTLVFEDDITLMSDSMEDWEEQEKVYILQEDWQEWYLDDESCDIEQYYEVDDPLSWEMFKAWCLQEGLKVCSGKALIDYVKEVRQ